MLLVSRHSIWFIIAVVCALVPNTPQSQALGSPTSFASSSSSDLSTLPLTRHCDCNSSDTMTLELLIRDDEGDVEMKYRCGLSISIEDLKNEPPGIKIEGKSNIQEPLMTLVVYSEHTKGIYVHWLISKLTGVHGRMGPMYSHLLSPGWEYIPYQHPSKEDSPVIIALFKQKPEKHYYMQHRIRDKSWFFGGLGEIIACNQLALMD